MKNASTYAFVTANDCRMLSLPIYFFLSSFLCLSRVKIHFRLQPRLLVGNLSLRPNEYFIRLERRAVALCMRAVRGIARCNLCTYNTYVHLKARSYKALFIILPCEAQSYKFEIQFPAHARRVSKQVKFQAIKPEAGSGQCTAHLT